MPYPAHGRGFFCGGRDREHGFSCGGHGRRMTVAEHRPLRSLGQGSAGFCRTLPAQSGNAPLSRLHRQLPLQGSLWGGCRPIKPPLQGEVDAPQAQAEGCGALPRKYLSGSPEASDRRTSLRRGADDFRLPARFAPAQGPRDDASIVPYAARGKALPDFAGHSLRKAAMHPSVGFAATSPYRGAFGRRPPLKYSKKPPPAGACLAGGGAVYAFGYGAFFPHGQALTERP